MNSTWLGVAVSNPRVLDPTIILLSEINLILLFPAPATKSRSVNKNVLSTLPENIFPNSSYDPLYSSYAPPDVLK